MYTAISRKVVRKNVHMTTPKGNMGYDQYTVPNDCRCRTYFCCFPLAIANICPWPRMPFFQTSLENRAAKPPTIPFGIVPCTFSDDLSQNSCMLHIKIKFRLILIFLTRVDIKFPLSPCLNY